MAITVQQQQQQELPAMPSYITTGDCGVARQLFPVELSQEDDAMYNDDNDDDDCDLLGRDAMQSQHHKQQNRNDKASVQPSLDSPPSSPIPPPPTPLTRVNVGGCFRMAPSSSSSSSIVETIGSTTSCTTSPNSISRELINTEESIRLGLARMGNINKGTPTVNIGSNIEKKKISTTGDTGVLPSGILKSTIPNTKRDYNGSSSFENEKIIDGVGEGPVKDVPVGGLSSGLADFFPPRYVVVGSPGVEFHEQVLVVEVDRVDEDVHGDVWWTLREMEQFRYEASRCKERRSKFGIRRSTRCVNHIRRVLLQQEASEELDGNVDDDYLAKLSAESSKKSRDSAFRAALRVEEEVEQMVILNQKTMGGLSDNMAAICLSPRIADYYIGSFLSMCGSL